MKPGFYVQVFIPIDLEELEPCETNAEAITELKQALEMQPENVARIVHVDEAGNRFSTGLFLGGSI